MKSALEGKTPTLFSALDRMIRCLFCGECEEGRWMCSACRPTPLGEIFWTVRAK